MRSLASLQTRAAFAMTAAVLAIFAVLMAVISYEELRRDTGVLDREALAAATRLVQALDELPTDAEALTFIRLFQQVAFADPGFDPAFALVATRLQAGTTLHTGDVPRVADWRRLPAGVSVERDGAVEYKVYSARGQHWQASIVDRLQERRLQLLTLIARDLAQYLAWVLPLMVLPVLFAVRSSLAPLKLLTAAVKERRPDDTTALVVKRSYSELEPLVAALNEQFRRAAQHLNRERAFVQDAAHELRTPLAVIGAQAHVLSKAEGDERESARVQLESAVARASHLTQQLLHLARAETPMRAPGERVDLMDVARECLAAFSAEASRRGVELELDGPDRLELRSDALLLRSILDNLVDNALRHGAPSSRPGAVEIEVITTGEGGVRLTVADRGPGVAEADREHAFERFWRAQRADGRGSGLGLAIVRESARALGGHARLTDRVDGPGCRVVVELPVSGTR